MKTEKHGLDITGNVEVHNGSIVAGDQVNKVPQPKKPGKWEWLIELIKSIFPFLGSK